MAHQAIERQYGDGTPRLADPSDAERSITSFISDTVETAGADGVVVGLSGGIDSTVSATLAVEALHRDNVYGLLLPTETTRESNIEDARDVAATLGIDYRIVDIRPLVEHFITTITRDQTEVRPDPHSDRSKRIMTSPVTRENYRIGVCNAAARLRMAALHFEVNTTNSLVLGTGNRTELLIGYFTKHGDGGVDCLPIGDLYKTEVRQLARHLGIPERIIEKPPTAGLWADQTDESELGTSYEQLDAILTTLVDRDRSVEEAASLLEIGPSEVAQVKEMMRETEHKRRAPDTPSESESHEASRVRAAQRNKSSDDQ